MTISVQAVRDSKCSHGVTCPRCKGTRVRWHGKDRLGQQRYRCTSPSCGKTFNDRTGTPLARTRLLGKWEAFAQTMPDHYSCRKAAKALGIDHKTAFYWRHKLINDLRAKVATALYGLVELDETYVVRSYKGHNKVTVRDPRKRGVAEGSISRGLGKDQVAIMVAVSRDGSTASLVVDQVSKDTLLKTFGNIFEPTSVLYSDGSGAIAAFAKEKKLEHHALNASKKERVRGIYHVNHVNAYHSRFKTWLRPFNGVSTAYLQNYAIWHLFHDQDRLTVEHGQEKLLFSQLWTHQEVRRDVLTAEQRSGAVGRRDRHSDVREGTRGRRLPASGDVPQYHRPENSG